MKFADAVRGELARVIPKRSCCQRAELSAFVGLLGRRSASGVDVASGHAAVARKVFLLGKQVPEVRVKTAEPGPGRSRYHVMLALQQPMPGVVPQRDCCARSYLRGAWLSRGSVSDPEVGYHLEFVLASKESAEQIRGLLQRYEIGAGVLRRKNDRVVYIKDADGIAEFLRLTGAHGALLRLEDFRVLKHMRNRVNRLVNSETANMEKVVSAALQQINDIRFIDEQQGLDSLPPLLKEVARLRLAHADLSLTDLGEQLTPPLSKSAINHRMRRLAQIAADLRRTLPAPS